MRGALIVASGTPAPIEGVPPWLTYLVGILLSSGLLAALVEGVRRALKLPAATTPAEPTTTPPPSEPMPRTTDARLDMAARLADKLEEDLQESEARAEELEEKVAELSGRLVALTNEVESLRAQRSVDRETIGQLRDVIQSLTSRPAP